VTDTVSPLQHGPGLRVDEMTVRPAASRQELEEAYRLVYVSYRRRGYIEESAAGVRLTVFNAFPSTVTFVSVLRGQVVATVTLVPDTPVGLPMDEIYREEVDALRHAGRTPVEVTMLADRRREIHRALPMLLRLMKHVFDYAMLVLRADDLCITINPRHETYYERFLFRPLGGLKSYPSVLQNPALAKRLCLDTAWEECEERPGLREQFFENRTPPERLRGGYGMNQADLQYFFVQLTPTFRQAPPPVIECLRRYYLGFPWDRWTARP
jgi:hypothetical protein